MSPWYIMLITAIQLHSTKPELRFSAGSSPAHDVLEIRDAEDLWQWFRLEIRLNGFCRSTISQKQFMIIIRTHSLRPIGLRGVTANAGSCASPFSGKILHLCYGVLSKEINISQKQQFDRF